MERNTKMTICAMSAFCAAMLSGIFFINNTSAAKQTRYGEERITMAAVAETTPETLNAAVESAGAEMKNGFRMLDGASIRLNKENDTYGIKFGVKVEDRTKNYTMMIVPTMLTFGYETNEEETLSQYCERKAIKAGGTVAKAENLQANEENEITCSLVNVRWENLNRDFTGIAYYETDEGKRIEAARAAEGERNIAEVARNALKSGELTEEERVAVERLKTDGEKQSNGIAVDTGLTEALFCINNEKSIGETNIHVSQSGDSWQISGGERACISVNPNVWKTRLRYAEGTASFALESKTFRAQVTMKNAQGETVFSEPLSPNERVEAKIATELLESCVEFSFECLDPLVKDTIVAYSVGEIREQTAAEAAAEQTAWIERLEQMQQSGNDIEIETKRAKRAYDRGLSETAKSMVENGEKLNELLSSFAKMKTLVSPERNENFIQKGAYESYSAYLQVKLGADKDQGTVWEVTRSPENAAEESAEYYRNRTEISYGAGLTESEKEELCEGCGSVKIYVYVDHVLAEGETLEIAFTEPDKRYKDAMGEADCKRVAVENGAWTTVLLTREEFVRFGRITAMFALLSNENKGKGGVIKIAAILGE